MKKFIGEFKAFALKGNVFDLAVGVIVGGAFGKIVNSLVADLIMPLAGIGLGKISFATLEWSPEPGIHVRYGMFIQTVVDFLIIAFSVFIAVKLVSKIRKKEEKEEKTETPAPKEIEILTEIRDILKEK